MPEDLVGTTWIIDNDPQAGDYEEDTDYNVYFTSNNQNFEWFGLNDYGEMALHYNSTRVWSPGGEWENENYRTITITGGTTTGLNGLKNFLMAHATQQTPVQPSLNFGGSDVTLFLGSTYVSKVYLGSTLLYEGEAPSASTISFTIGETPYQAESGWDFATWIESEYNTARYSADSNNKVIRVTRPRAPVLYLQLNGYGVYTTDTIVANGEYSEYML